MALEEETVEHVTRIHELEESDRLLRDRMEGSITAEQARQLRGKVACTSSLRPRTPAAEGLMH